VLVPSLIVSDESGPAVAERVALQAELAKRGLGVPLAKVTAADVAPRLAGPLMAARSVFFAGAVPAYTAAARPAIGSPSGPLLYFSYLVEPAALGELREAAALATWPGSRRTLASSISPALHHRSPYEGDAERARGPHLRLEPRWSRGARGLSRGRARRRDAPRRPAEPLGTQSAAGGEETAAPAHGPARHR